MESEASGLLVVAHGLSHDLRSPLLRLRRRLDELQGYHERNEGSLQLSTEEISVLVKDVNTVDRLLFDLTISIRQQETDKAAAALRLAEQEIKGILGGLYKTSSLLRERLSEVEGAPIYTLNLIARDSLRLRNKVAALFRLGTETSSSRPRVLDIKRVIDRAILETRAQMQIAKGELTVGEMPTLQVDAEQMQVLFTNLLSNSIKYRSKSKRLQISIWHDNMTRDQIYDRLFVALKGPKNLRYCVIHVRDNGIGIRKEDQNRIFNLFVRVGGSDDEYMLESRSRSRRMNWPLFAVIDRFFALCSGRARKPVAPLADLPPTSVSGEGVGLAVCKYIARWHGGDIFVTSVYGEGSTFSVALPMLTARKDKGVIYKYIETEKLLVIEDDQEMVDIYYRVAQQFGLAIDHIKSEQEFEMYLNVPESGHSNNAKASVPILIFLDLYLQRGAGGISILSRIKDTKRRKQTGARFEATPIIVVSSSNDPHEIYRCYRDGANAYIIKNISPREMQAAITETVRYWTKSVALPQIYR